MIKSHSDAKCYFSFNRLELGPPVAYSTAGHAPNRAPAFAQLAPLSLQRPVPRTSRRGTATVAHLPYGRYPLSLQLQCFLDTYPAVSHGSTHSAKRSLIRLSAMHQAFISCPGLRPTIHHAPFSTHACSIKFIWIRMHHSRVQLTYHSRESKANNAHLFEFQIPFSVF